MSTWTGVPPGVPVTVATPPVQGVSVGPGPQSVVVVPEDWMHIVPDFQPARFTTEGSLAAAAAVSAVPGFTADVVLGATIATYTELVAAAETAAAATGRVDVPLTAAQFVEATLTAAQAAGTVGVVSGAGTLTAASAASGTVPALFETDIALAAAVDRAGFAAAFTGGGKLTAKVSQGYQAGADFEASGALAATVLVVFVRDAEYRAAAALSSVQAVAPQDGKTAGASLAAQSSAIAITTPAASGAGVLTATAYGALSFIPMGAYLSTSFNPTPQWSVFPPLTALPTYPDTVLAGNAIVPSPGMARVNVKVTRQSGGGDWIDFRLLQGGVVVKTHEPGGATFEGSTAEKEWEIELTGEPLTLEGKTYWGSRQFIAGESNTFITINPA